MNLSSVLSRCQRQTWMLALVAALLAGAVGEGIFRSGIAAGGENFYTDIWHRLAGQRAVPVHTALVMIDDASLNAHPDEPLAFWTPHFAKALATLRTVGSKLVAIDFLFSGSPERWIGRLGPAAQEASRDYDRKMREEINRGKVLLVGFRMGEGKSAEEFLLPTPDYLLALPDMDIGAYVGLANLRDEGDSVVRGFAIAEASGAAVTQEGMPRLAFASLAAVHSSGQDAHAPSLRFGNRDAVFDAVQPIAFSGPPGTFRAVSFETLLRDDAATLPEVRALAGRTVIIGAGYAGMNDLHPTPYSTNFGGGSQLMSGPEIQANIVETLLGGRHLDPVAPAVRLAAFMAVLGFLAALGVRLSPLRATLLVLAAMPFTAAAAYTLFRDDRLFPIAHLHIGMIVLLIFLVLLRLTREERERARMGVIFGRYVSGQVMTAMLASPELPELGGQSMRISVLFSDIRNFTTISEKLTAREVVEMLNTYFERACAVLLVEGATIDKFIGDAIMAEFGAPVSHPDHAVRALRAALALHQVAVEFRGWMATRFADRDLPPFEIGIGVNTGEAIVGNIGSSTRMEYTSIGDTVNIASRLEGKTKETGCAILAAAETVAAAGDVARIGVHIGARHFLQVKGRAQAVEAVEVLG